jgi:serine/threonine-protein kinase
MTSSSAASIRIAEYELFERLGEGGSGQVYRATDRTGAQVAIKLLGPAADLDPASARARFDREVRVLAQLAHPNLVSLIAHGLDEELGPYLVTPLIPGKHLRGTLGGQALCPEAAVLLLEPVAAAVAALHAQDLIHRDLKPENVMVTPDGRVIVVDLGLAWGPQFTRHTEEGAALGSIPYMAPEQLEGTGVGTAADVWALAVMLYELIAGKRPFARARPSEEAAAALVGAYPPLDAVAPRTPPELARLVAAGLDRAPAARPDAAAFDDALRSAVDWIDVADATRERAAVIASPTAYLARVAPFRVRREQRLAREALAAGRPFAALAHVDRGLAYAPADPDLLALATQAEAGSAHPARAAGASPPRLDSPTPATPGVASRATDGDGDGDADADLATIATQPAPISSSAAARPAPSTLAGVATAATGDSPGGPTSPATAAGPPLRTTAIALATVAGAVVAIAATYVVLRKREPAAASITTATSAAPPTTSPAGPADRTTSTAPSPSIGPTAHPDSSGPPTTGSAATTAPGPAPDRADPATGPVLPGLPPLGPADLDRKIPITIASMYAPAGGQLVPAEMLDADTPAKAVAQLDADVARDPSPRNRLGQAMVYLGAGRTADGLAKLDRVLREHPDDATGWAAKGYVDLRAGKPTEAEADFTRAITLDPSDAKARANRGIMRKRLGRLADAYADLTAALRLDPSDVDALAELAQVYQSVDRRDDARPLIERIAKLRPNNPEIWLDLSEVQPPAEALASVTRALTMAPTLPRAHVRRCEVLSAAASKDALAACDDAVKIAPTAAWAWMSRGLARYQIANDRGGLADMDQAIKLQPRSSQLYINRSISRSHAGMTAEARADLQQACDLGAKAACTALKAP